MDLEAESVVQVVVVPLTLMHDAIENAEIGVFLSMSRGSWSLDEKNTIKGCHDKFGGNQEEEEHGEGM